MKIKNILNDGTEAEELQGHIVRIGDAPEAYVAIREGEKHGDNSD